MDTHTHADLYIIVLTPMSRPLLSSKGPPELPGLTAASVCTTSLIIRPVTGSQGLDTFADCLKELSEVEFFT